MNICVYGASSNEVAPFYLQAAQQLGGLLARHGHGLVFGGGAQGLMGATARGAHEAGGSILGIAPTFFRVDGILYEDCSDFIYTETMRERKQLMEEKSDGFVVTPGGVGTFEEFFEILTLKQLGRHNKPIAVLNTNGYYDAMLHMLENAVQERFMRAPCLQLYRMCDTPDEVLAYLEGYDATALDVAHLKNI